MDHIPEEDLATVSAESRAVVGDAKAAGVWIWGGGIRPSAREHRGHRRHRSWTDADPETKRAVGGFSILEVASREEALDWAARIARACRCPQEVREIGYDPES